MRSPLLGLLIPLRWSRCHPLSLPSPRGPCSSISCSALLLVMNSFPLVCLKKSLFHLQFWKILIDWLIDRSTACWAEDSRWTGFYFSFSALKMFLPCLLARIVSREESRPHLRVLWTDHIFFSPDAFKSFLTITVFEQSDYNMLWCGSSHTSCT